MFLKKTVDVVMVYGENAAFSLTVFMSRVHVNSLLVQRYSPCHKWKFCESPGFTRRDVFVDVFRNGGRCGSTFFSGWEVKRIVILVV